MEAHFRSMLESFMAHSNTNNLEETIANTLCAYANTDSDEQHRALLNPLKNGKMIMMANSLDT